MGSASTTVSPLTISNVHSTKELNKVQSSPSPIMNASIGQSSNLINNLHALNAAIGGSNNNGNKGISNTSSQSPTIGIHMPNYLNIMATNSNNLARNNLTNNNNSCNNGATNNSIFNGTLDLINGVENANPVTGLNRQIRLRAYGNNKNGMVRHETKL